MGPRAWRARVTEALAVSIVGVVGPAACLGELDYTGKRCAVEGDCPAGWFCNAEHCGRAQVSDASSASDAPDVRCVGSFDVKDFHAAWTTSNTIRWEWEPLGAAEAFGRYEVHLDTNQERLEAGEASLKIDSQTNPELGFITLPGATNVPVKASVTFGLAPAGGAWFGQLVAYDRFGCTFRSNVAPAQLRVEPRYEAVLFRDALRPSSSLSPAASVPGVTRGRIAFNPDCDGNPCLDYEADSPGGENLVLTTTIAPSELVDLSPARFDLAFLEFRVWLDSADAFWTGAWLVANSTVFTIEPFTPMRTQAPAVQANYRVVQIPLRELSSTSGKLTHADAATGFTQFRFYTAFANGSRVWLDDIAIRW